MKKGFTLIELLAVIVVLAIIALIATPIILGVIDKAKIGAAENSALGYVDAVEKQVVINQMDTSKSLISMGTYNMSELTEKGVKIKGKIETANVTIDEKGLITIGTFCIYDKSIDYNGKVAKYNKNANYCNGEVADTEQLVGTSIGEKTEIILSNNVGNTFRYLGDHSSYLKGVQESNYVWYNGFLWRIMGKNEDGTIRLITEENVTTIPWGKHGEVNWEAEGYIKDWLNKYFLNNLDSSKTDIIKESNWCINPYDGTYPVGTVPLRTDCPSDKLVQSKVGLISIDEYNLSGASKDNSTYGLINSQIFWTLTPCNEYYSWFVSNDSSAKYTAVTSFYGVRPVINVNPSAIITDGDGTLGNEFILNQTLSDKKDVELINNASSGEYVSLNERIYRVVSTNDEKGTKLIYDEYYKKDGNIYYKKFNTDSNVFNIENELALELNTSILTDLGISDKIVDANWYQTSGIDMGSSYATILNDKSDPKTAKVGLIRVGEMLSGTSASILTNNYNEKSSIDNVSGYTWTMTKSVLLPNIWSIYYTGSIETDPATYAKIFRPVVVVNSVAKITSGNGTLDNPYIID